MIKFLLHSASYMWFLITLLGESIAMEVYRDRFASREQTILHNSFHMVWVVGTSQEPRFMKNSYQKLVEYQLCIHFAARSSTSFLNITHETVQ